MSQISRKLHPDTQFQHKHAVNILSKPLGMQEYAFSACIYHTEREASGSENRDGKKIYRYSRSLLQIMTMCYTNQYNN